MTESHVHVRTAHTAAYTGPERRAAAAAGRPQGWMSTMLDEIDYGMMLVAADARVLFMNHAARVELDGAHPLQLLGLQLRTRRPQDLAPLLDALAGAQQGKRKLLTLGQGDDRVCLSVVPLPADGSPGRETALTLLVLGKRRVCEHLSVEGFARSAGLTPTETHVLERLCNGVPPAAIAHESGVAVCTVRTQIGSIRAKTGASSIRELVRQVAVLPPLVGALRCLGPAAA